MSNNLNIALLVYSSVPFIFFVRSFSASIMVWLTYVLPWLSQQGQSLVHFHMLHHAEEPPKPGEVAENPGDVLDWVSPGILLIVAVNINSILYSFSSFLLFLSAAYL
jgi:hypothetical protein